jgi:hypothetical protein
MQSTEFLDGKTESMEGANKLADKEIIPSDESHNSENEKVSVQEGLREDDTQYLRGYKLFAVCVAICLAIFLVALVRNLS